MGCVMWGWIKLRVALGVVEDWGEGPDGGEGDGEEGGNAWGRIREGGYT